MQESNLYGDLKMSSPNPAVLLGSQSPNQNPPKPWAKLVRGGLDHVLAHELPAMCLARGSGFQVSGAPSKL